MSFKLQIVQEIEGQLTVTESTKTYGIQNRTTVVKWLRNSVTLIGKTKHHLLCQSRQNKRSWSLNKVETSRETEVLLERQAFVADKKAIIDMMIDIAEEI
jgi:transposase-like protein